MIRWSTLTALAFIIGVCSGWLSADDVPYWETDQVYVQYMGASWCGPCRTQKPLAKRLSAEYGLPLTEFDIDTPVGRQAHNNAQRLTGPSIPVVTVCRRGKILDHITGQCSESRLSELLTRHGASKAQSQPQSFQVVREVVQQPQIPRFQQTQWGPIDLATYNRPGCNCPMCQGIRALQAQYNQPQFVTVEKVVPLPVSLAASVATQAAGPSSIPDRPEQEPTPYEQIDAAIRALDLTPTDTLADLGCGDGRVLIAAVRASGCRGIGVEIDPHKAEQARKAVDRAGLTAQITIVTGDACEFDLTTNGVTVVFVYLWEDLLKKLSPKLSTVRVVSPFHQVPGLTMAKSGDLWVTKETVNVP